MLARLSFSWAEPSPDLMHSSLDHFGLSHSVMASLQGFANSAGWMCWSSQLCLLLCVIDVLPCESRQAHTKGFALHPLAWHFRPGHRRCAGVA